MKRRFFVSRPQRHRCGWRATTLVYALSSVDGLRATGRRGMRAPADLLAQICRRTRPLDMEKLTRNHDLAG